MAPTIFTAPSATPPDPRQIWRAAVAEIAAKAQAALPACNGRVEKAAAIALNGDVELLPDGTAQVASQSNGQTVYHVVNGECSCKDFPQAPQGFCKHRLAAGITKRAYALAKATLAATSTPVPQFASREVDVLPPPLPEAPASVNVHVTIAGRQVQVTLRDTDETRLLQRLDTLLQRFPVETPAQTLASPQTPVCQWHGPLKASTKAKGMWYCPAKMADGSYCKVRHPATAAHD